MGGEHVVGQVHAYSGFLSIVTPWRAGLMVSARQGVSVALLVSGS